MSIEAQSDDKGWIEVKVTKEFLEKSGFLWFLNQSLHAQRMRAHFKLDPKGVPQLYLTVLPDIAGPTFEYSAEAEGTHSKQWNDFLREMRP